MKQAITFLSAAFLCGTMLSCNNKKESETPEPKHEEEVKNYSQLEKTNWLIGKWGRTTGRITISENWEKANDSTYNGNHYIVLGGTDTVHHKLELQESAKKLSLTISDSEGPVSYEMVSSTDTQVVFENPKKDKPKKITYRKTDDYNMVIETSRVVEGKPISNETAMKRQ
ncbi:DUF6265 family protein [Flavobacterium sp. DGU11]|uniref:DUF6265 family protein n=1 Tax=Flavobacterium arundinis TaxID=3139143 RepID=A0ABU9HY47_9FLAO